MQHFYAPEDIISLEKKVGAFIQTSKINYQLPEIDHILLIFLIFSSDFSGGLSLTCLSGMGESE